MRVPTVARPLPDWTPQGRPGHARGRDRGPEGGTLARTHRTSVVRVQPRTSRSITDLLSTLVCAHSPACAVPSEKQDPALSGRSGGRRPSHPTANRGRGDRRLGPPFRDRTLHTYEAGAYWKAEVSLVVGINQTDHSTNQ